jgi:hypothetical protein
MINKRQFLNKIKAETSSGNHCSERSYTYFDEQVNKYYVAEWDSPDNHQNGFDNVEVGAL